MSLMQERQNVNSTPATRRKSERLEVITMTRITAYVAGDHDTYAVDLTTLACSCPAGVVGLRCSHAMAAVREQASRAGMTFCTFARSVAHAASWAALQRAKGNVARVEERGRYIVCLFGTPPPPPPPVRPVRSFEALTAAADELFAY